MRTDKRLIHEHFQLVEILGRTDISNDVFNWWFTLDWHAWLSEICFFFRSNLWHFSWSLTVNDNWNSCQFKLTCYLMYYSLKFPKFQQQTIFTIVSIFYLSIAQSSRSVFFPKANFFKNKKKNKYFPFSEL